LEQYSLFWAAVPFEGAHQKCFPFSCPHRLIITADRVFFSFVSQYPWKWILPVRGHRSCWNAMYEKLTKSSCGSSHIVHVQRRHCLASYASSHIGCCGNTSSGSLHVTLLFLCGVLGILLVCLCARETSKGTFSARDFANGCGLGLGVEGGEAPPLGSCVVRAVGG